MVTAIRTCELPATALLGQYRRSGAYTDCYATEVPHVVTQAAYVEAFYTTPLFKFERLLLACLVLRPSTDLQARALAQGKLEAFAAWSVEARGEDQLLLRDFQGRTRSWLMCEPVAVGAQPGTRLYFGSAVVPKAKTSKGTGHMGLAFHALLGFHKCYSKLLLRAATDRLARARATGRVRQDN